MRLRDATLSDLHEVASWVDSARECDLWAGWRVSFPIDIARLAQEIEFSNGNSFCLVDQDSVIAFGQIIKKAQRAHLAQLIYLSEGDQGHPGTWAWIGVEDVAALHEEYVNSGATILEAPRNYAWAYEMQVADPDGHVLRFGSEPRADIPFES